MARSTLNSPVGSEVPEARLMLAFLPLHKRALGAGMGTAAGLLVFAVTMVHLVRASTPYPLDLLAQYFYGYSVSPWGAVVGMFWAAFAGFVAGWFFAFCRNLALAISTFIIRTRAELKEMREFLDHI